MRDLTVSMRDGHSTSGSLGMGLGVIRRIASFFEIYSLRDSGTAILCRMLRPLSGPKPERNFIVGGVCIAKTGEEQSGDQWASRTYGDDLQILVSDGSGHGLLAHDASVAAVASFLERGQATPSVIMERAHQALRSTRGAATAVSEINTARQELRFAGVGNITGTILNGPLRRNAVSHHGTLGHQVQKFQEFSYPWKDDAVLVMCSDGVSTRWTLDQYPGLIQRHPSLIAGVLYRDFGRNSDDTCVVVARGNS
jgi:Stage II sporulation protein E (SpoIIE)